MLIAVGEVVSIVLSATKCLAWHFVHSPIARETVHATLRLLRVAMTLSSHGRQSLNTASVALLCVAIMNDRDFDPTAPVGIRCSWLLSGLGSFDTAVSFVRYHWTGNCASCYLARVDEYRGQPLRIMGHDESIAEGLTLPFWARFQYICHESTAPRGLSLFKSFICGDEVDFPHSAMSPFHVRFHLPASWDLMHYEEDLRC